MRSKHSFIFTFIYKKDYNSRIIKIDLFFVVFAANYAVNTLFYNEATMQNRAENKGLNLEYQIPKIVYSTLISTFLEFLLKLLALSNDAIIDFKRDKNDKNIKEREEKLKNKLIFKFVLYFLLSFILLIAFWYYISMFCAIYPYSQVLLLEDTLISLALSQIIPFFTNLIPGFFRIPSLARRKRKKERLYKFSKLLQMF